MSDVVFNQMLNEMQWSLFLVEIVVSMFLNQLLIIIVEVTFILATSRVA